MGWQLVLVAGCVAAAAWYVGRQTWRAWSGGAGGCGGGCHCPSKPKSRSQNNIGSSAPLISPAELTARLHRGR